jgi:hypothetical protein
MNGLSLPHIAAPIGTSAEFSAWELETFRFALPLNGSDQHGAVAAGLPPRSMLVVLRRIQKRVILQRRSDYSCTSLLA